MHIHIFRRDLRLEDNTALNNTPRNIQILPIFIFTPKQIETNEYKSPFAITFLCNSLHELDEELQKHQSKLHVFYGEVIQTLATIHKVHKIRSLSINKDYTPFATKRDREIEDFCKHNSIEFQSYDDALLTSPGSVHKDDNNPYTIYTPFYKKASQQKIPLPVTKLPKFSKLDIGNDTLINKIKENHIPQTKNLSTNVKPLLFGGRKEGLKLLENIQNLTDYTIMRDFPSHAKTSHLSAHHKFGTISIRETYNTASTHLGTDCQYIRELYWRDFATHIVFHFPYVFGSEFQKQYQNLEWENPTQNAKDSKSASNFIAWCNGLTGFPIIDAGMRELNATGYMHNRVRMIVASFLTKDLHINWRLGEKYFAQKLVDYDPAVNNTSWQWAASTGCDAQPYFRIFNPWLQQEKFDSDCEYIKKWVPELAKLTPKQIHNLHTQRPLTLDNQIYPHPIIIHAIEKDVAIAMFKSI
jgi:deoxyribodipyrimidine photo-lyase